MDRKKDISKFDWIEDIIIPETWEELDLIVKKHKNNKTIIPVFNPTALQTPLSKNTKGIVICNISDLPEFMEINKTALYLKISANTTISKANRYLANNKMNIPNMPVYQNTSIGGWISTNSSGLERLDYGTAEKDILGIDVILPDGNTVFFGRKTQKGVAGYEIARLFIDKWGYSGIIKSVIFRIRPVESHHSFIKFSLSNPDDLIELKRHFFFKFRTLKSAFLINTVDATGYKTDCYIILRGNYHEVLREKEGLITKLNEYKIHTVELKDANPEKLTKSAENLLNKSEYFISGFIMDDMEGESSLINKLKEICSFTYNLIGNEVNIYTKNTLIDKEPMFEGMKIKTFSKKISGIYINNPSKIFKFYKFFTNNT